MATTTITVSTEIDVMTARMKVRDLARKLGMNTTDQARLAMATSAMATHLGLGGTCEGGIAIEPIEVDGRTGLQVQCFQTDGSTTPCPSKAALQDAKWMIDEVTLETLPTHRVRIALIKWLASS